MPGNVVDGVGNCRKAGQKAGLRVEINLVHQMIVAAMATVEAKFAASLSYLVAMRRQSLRRQNARSILLRSL